MIIKQTHGSQDRWSKEIIDMDREIYELGKGLNLSAILRPTNYSHELSRFLESPYQYNPIFEYRFPNESYAADYQRRLDELRKMNTSLESQSPIFFRLFDEKIQEL